MGEHAMSLLSELIDAYRFARRPIYRAAIHRLGLQLGEGYLWGLAPVAADSLFYEPDPEGELALIVGAFERGALFDLVAVSPFTFGIRTRLGEANLLGADWLEVARWHERSLKLYAEPFSWLRHGRNGAVILDWRGIGFRLSDMPSIVCETEALADQVRDAFARPLPLPPVRLMHPTEKPHA
jgi:hypothetical protein